MFCVDKKNIQFLETKNPNARMHTRTRVRVCVCVCVDEYVCTDTLNWITKNKF